MNAQRTAFHESAHALIAWHFGFILSSVTIQPESGTAQDISGICRAAASDEGSTDIITGPGVLSSEKAYFTLAGRACDDLYFPSEPNGSAKDFENLKNMIPADSKTLEMHEYARDEKNIEKFYKKFKKPVEKILRSSKGKRSLKALSRALLNNGTLSGAESVTIIENAWRKPFPPKAKPAADHMTLKSKGRKTYQGLLQSVGAYVQIMADDIEKRRFNFQESQNEHLNRIRHQILLLKIVLQNDKRKK